MFAKVKDHLVRVDQDVTCKSCGKRFEIPSHQNIVFLEELEGSAAGRLRRVEPGQFKLEPGISFRGTCRM